MIVITQGRLFAAALVWALSLCVMGCGEEESPGGVDFAYVWPDAGQRQGCSNANCVGCCQGDTCMSGTTTGTCGIGGAACVTCQPRETCSGGSCVAQTCDADSCPDGCCGVDNTCQAGDTVSACGGGGALCEICDSDETCTSRICTAKDPGLKSYTVIAEGANLTGAALVYCNTHFNDVLCDVYLNVKSGGVEGNTKTINNSMSPKWNKTLFTVQGTHLKAGLTVKVYDDDPGPINPRIYSVTYKVTDVDLASGQASFDCSAGGVTMATLVFKLTAS